MIKGCIQLIENKNLFQRCFSLLSGIEMMTLFIFDRFINMMLDVLFYYLYLFYFTVDRFLYFLHTTPQAC